MKTIEELGQLARDTWDIYGGRALGAHTAYEKEAFVEVAKAIVTALAKDGVSWAPTDEEIDRA